MADISTLALTPLSEEERLAVHEEYKGASEGYRRPPPEGKYLFQAPSKLNIFARDAGDYDKDAINVTATKKGKLLFCLSGVKLADGDNKGQTAQWRFLYPARSQYRNGTDFHDYLRAHGMTALPRSEQEMVNAAEATIGRLFPAIIQWEWQCQDCDGFDPQVEGSSAVPKNEHGQPQAVIKCKTCKKDLYARFSLKQFVSTVADGAGKQQTAAAFA